MDIYQYIAENNTKEALALFRNYSRLRVSDPDDLADGLRDVMKNLPFEAKEDYLLQLSAIHPDAELLQKNAIESSPTDQTSHHCNCPSCQIKFGANGQNAVNHFLSTGEIASVIEKERINVSKEIESIKQENATKKLVNDKIFQIFVIAVIVYFAYKQMSK